MLVLTPGLAIDVDHVAVLGEAIDEGGDAGAFLRKKLNIVSWPAARRLDGRFAPRCTAGWPKRGRYNLALLAL